MKTKLLLCYLQTNILDLQTPAEVLFQPKAVYVEINMNV
jgi:hypothetical protein